MLLPVELCLTVYKYCQAYKEPYSHVAPFWLHVSLVWSETLVRWTSGLLSLVEGLRDSVARLAYDTLWAAKRAGLVYSRNA
jgi:hypothetical protein